MAVANPVKSIAIVGATGNLGSLILKHLLATNNFEITALTRTSSTTTIPSHPSLTIKSGDYTSAAFLASVFKGIDALILALNFSATGEPQIKLIEAAAESGVKYIIPTEFGSDNAIEALVTSVPITAPKVAARKRVEELAETHEGLNWIGFVTNPWLDFSLSAGMWSIHPQNRTATLYDRGLTPFNTTTLPTAALAVSRLLSLPSETLDKFGNRFVYVSSFRISQRDILSSVQRVTSTTDEDWKIEYADTQAWMDEGREKMSKGDFSGAVSLVYGNVLREGNGGDYEMTRGMSNATLGLEEEKLDEVVQRTLKDMGLVEA